MSKKSFRRRERTHEATEEHFSRLVAVQRAVPRVASLTVALVRGGRVDAGGERVTVVETQPAFLHIRAGGVGPHRISLLVVQVLQLQLHLQGPRRGRGLGLRAGRAGRGEVYHVHLNLLLHGAMLV